MNCEQANEMMMKHFDGVMNDIENAQFKQHLKICNTCSLGFASLSEVFSTLEEDGNVEPPEEFEEKVMERVHSVAAKRTENIKRSRILVYCAAGISLIALAAALAVNLGGITDSIGSFVSDVVTLYNIATVTANQIFKVFSEMLKTYNYYIAAMMFMFLVIQKLAMNIRKQGRLREMYASLSKYYKR
ncbi:MAG: zf-HC2 domain-containing protein [Clostridia bacterium]|nr:zf-HC2 domain-containing protein [Clostridia bacterium]